MDQGTDKCIRLKRLRSTRRSENDKAPQPLDQWTNSLFMDQQPSNCKSSTLIHYLADLFARASENIFRLQCKRGSSKWASPHHKQFATFLRNFYIFKQLLGNFKIWASVRRALFSGYLPCTVVNPIVHPTHIPFIPSESTLPFLRSIQQFQYHTLKIQG